MRAIPLLIFTLLLTGCGTYIAPPRPEATVEEPPRPAAFIEMRNPADAGQLKSGFHEIEQGAWRWTMRRFSVALRPPPGSRMYGARLEFKFTVPDVAWQAGRDLTLSANLNGRKLPVMRISRAGEATYSALVPKEALEPELATVQFELSRAFQSPGGDPRELGVIASSVGLVEP